MVLAENGDGALQRADRLKDILLLGVELSEFFLGREVALSKAAWFFAISDAKFLISVFKRALVAVASSIVAVKSVMRASASSIDVALSLSLVSHQQVIFSKTSSSSSPSFSSCVAMSLRRLITFVTGRFLSTCWCPRAAVASAARKRPANSKNLHMMCRAAPAQTL